MASPAGGPPAGVDASSSSRSFSQVVFQDVPRSFSPRSPVTCSFSLSSSLQPSSRDWVGIFKVGWTSTKEYFTFVWVEPRQEGAEPAERRQVVFKEYYLPKDEVDFYQFCYVDGGGQMRGHSSTFCFSEPDQLNSDCCADDELLVVTTQEQVEQGVREREELQKEVEEERAQREALEEKLEEEQRRVCSLEEEKKKSEEERMELLRKLEESKEEKNNLERALKEQEENQQQAGGPQMTRSQSLTAGEPSKDKYERAVMKINQLKEERETLKSCVEVQSEEISKLKAKTREDERELSKTKDRTHLLEVDLQSSQKETQRLSMEAQKLRSSLEEEKRENQELRRRLTQNQNQNQNQNQTQGGASEEDLKTLTRQLEEATAKLCAEKEERGNVRRKADYLEGEVQEVRGQLERVMKTYELEQRKSNKLQLQLREMNEMLADKDIALEEKEDRMSLEKKEKEELSRINQSLRSDIEGLRRAFSDLQASSASSPLRAQQDAAAASAGRDGSADVNAAGVQQQETAGDEGPESLYQNIEAIVASQEEDEEQTLVCSLCEESFPGITAGELELHQQSHRVCPFCPLLCDLMEQSDYEDHVYSHEL